MIGINIGSLNSTVAIGHRAGNGQVNKVELLLSETSSRICPSLLSFTDDHRIIGDQASLVLRKNIKSSFQYINRYIGFDMDTPFTQKEFNSYQYVGEKYDKEQKKCCYTLKGQKYFLGPDEIVVSYLHLLYNSYILQKNISPECLVFTVPDYFTTVQKLEYLKNIKSAGITNDFHLVNESSAITLYFGYKKYKEYFIHKTEGTVVTVDPTIIKYILFIDAGHSKISFILSKLSYNLFYVLDSYTVPFLGGRDFDDALYKYCCDKFKKDNDIDVSKNAKIKLRLLIPIMKARKNLTVNKDAQISVDSLSDDIDFSVILTREDFEKIISDKINMFKEELIKFVEKTKQTYPDIDLTNVEMAGELMRTPALEKIVKDVTGIEISKSILTDECLSIGSSLYASLLKGCFPVKDFKGIYHLNHYTLLSKIDDGKFEELASNHHQIPDFKSFNFDAEALKNKINISFYYLKDEIKDYVNVSDEKDDQVLLISYDILSDEILKTKKNVNNLKVTFLIDNLGDVHIKGMESVVTKDHSTKIELTKSIVKVVKRNLYISGSEINKKVGELAEKENVLFEQDQDFINLSIKKNDLESNLYDVKNMIQSNNLENNQCDGKSISFCLREIEDQITNNVNKLEDLKPLEENLKNILLSVTPKNVQREKERILGIINKFSKSIEDAANNLKQGKRSKFTENEIRDVKNMLEHFKKKLHLAINLNDVKNLNRDFEGEKRKFPMLI